MKGKHWTPQAAELDRLAARNREKEKIVKHKLYVASSWRNQEYPSVVEALSHVHEVYDFRNPAPGNHGFSWSEIHKDWQNWNPSQLRGALAHPIAQEGFKSDFDAMQWATAFVLVLPCGRSAHLEAGWAIGQGKPLAIYVPVPVEPELMYLTGGDKTRLCVTLGEVVHFLEEQPVK